MSDAYAAAGVDTGQADRAVGALVAVLRTIEPGRPSRLGAAAAATTPRVLRVDARASASR